MATSTTNDGFHEIQLNGKQLVFLGMAVVVVSVVIFLMGVLVGRGVRAAQVPLAEAPTADVERSATAGTDVPPAPPPPIEDPVPVEDETTPGPGSSAVDSLETDKMPGLQPPSTKAKPPARAPAAEGAARPPAAAPPSAAPVGAPAPAPRATAVTVPTEPSGTGWSIQVAALAEKGDAEAMVTHLLGKEYSAYLVLPSGGSPMYRVRVGKFKDKREADRVAGRLTKEEKFKPWVIK
jgi:cell division septation protein DedD